MGRLPWPWPRPVVVPMWRWGGAEADARGQAASGSVQRLFGSLEHTLGLTLLRRLSWAQVQARPAERCRSITRSG
jgi:hypothetical protein